MELSLYSIESVRPSSLQVFANSSTLHGMSHIFAYGHMTFRRFLWTLSFMGSLGLLMFVCMDRVYYYFEFPHVTKLDEVAAPNLTFPAVTFCNLNEFRFSKITKNDLYHVGELLALLNENHQIANPHLAEPEVLALLKEKANFVHFKAKQFNMTDFYNRTGHDINEMLLQCTFRGEDCIPLNFTTVSYHGGIFFKVQALLKLHKQLGQRVQCHILAVIVFALKGLGDYERQEDLVKKRATNVKQVLSCIAQ
uniref:Uncharacterized protein n=1 Tax=Cyprinus carpio TaxID=7962 RepID=A0A8C1CHH5_CYPCA